MPSRSVTAIALYFSALLVGCASVPTNPSPSSEAEVEAALEQMAAEANTAGDRDAADGFSGGALALRLGVRPTEIGVTVNGETTRYWAVVAGIAHALASGPSVLKRTLIAWSRSPDGKPTAILQVSLLSDEGVFGFPADLNTALDPRGRARGTWVDRRRDRLYVAISGAAGITPETVSDTPCVGSLSEDSGLRCVQATYAVQADGRFAALLTRDARTADQLDVLLIQTAGEGVNGILITAIPRSR